MNNATQQIANKARNFAHGCELVPGTARLAIVNTYLHGINADPCPIRSGADTGMHVLELTGPARAIAAFK